MPFPLGYRHSDETKAKISASGRGRIVSDETRALLSQRKWSDESKAKIAEANRRRFEDPAEREKAALQRMGEKSQFWLGDAVGYVGAHRRAGTLLDGQPCAYEDWSCSATLVSTLTPDAFEFVRFDKNGDRHSPRPEDYIRVCRSHLHRFHMGSI